MLFNNPLRQRNAGLSSAEDSNLVKPRLASPGPYALSPSRNVWRGRPASPSARRAIMRLKSDVDEFMRGRQQARLQPVNSLQNTIQIERAALPSYGSDPHSC